MKDRIEGKWIDTFVNVFKLCAIEPGDVVAILSETQSRAINVHLAELALQLIGAKPFHVIVPTPPQALANWTKSGERRSTPTGTVWPVSIC